MFGADAAEQRATLWFQLAWGDCPAGTTETVAGLCVESMLTAWTLLAVLEEWARNTRPTGPVNFLGLIQLSGLEKGLKPVQSLGAKGLGLGVCLSRQYALTESEL